MQVASPLCYLISNMDTLIMTSKFAGEFTLLDIYLLDIYCRSSIGLGTWNTEMNKTDITFDFIEI